MSGCFSTLHLAVLLDKSTTRVDGPDCIGSPPPPAWSAFQPTESKREIAQSTTLPPKFDEKPAEESSTIDIKACRSRLQALAKASGFTSCD